jgi:HSP20 family protein
MENKKNDALIRACCNALIPDTEEVEVIVAPDANVFETRDAFIVELDMPGVMKESITVTADAQILSVSSEQTTGDTKSGKFLLNEIEKKKYQREFHLGKGIKLDKISAEYKDGVLLVTLPKAEEAKPKQIEVKVK